MTKIFIAATFDTKAQEANYIKNIISNLNLPVISVDLSTSNAENSSADIQAREVAETHHLGDT